MCGHAQKTSTALLTVSMCERWREGTVSSDGAFSHLSYLCKLVFWASKTVCLTKNIKLFGATLDKASGI